MDNPEMLGNPKLEQIISQYFDNKVDKQIVQEVPGNIIESEVQVNRHDLKYKLVDKHFKNSQIRDFLRTRVICHLISEDGSPAMNELILKYRKEVKNKSYQEQVQTYLDKYAYIDDGSLAPELLLEDLAGQEVALSDFQGKYVYIDVWASWCAPCRHEIPYFEKLKHEYKEKNIEFISISMDRTKAPWKQFLYDWQLNEHQYFASGSGHADLSARYKIQGLPQFILIDPEGQIVDLSAARPSGGIRDDFSRLNI